MKLVGSNQKWQQIFVSFSYAKRRYVHKKEKNILLNDPQKLNALMLIRPAKIVEIGIIPNAFYRALHHA